jgi:hypothetical protein
MAVSWFVLDGMNMSSIAVTGQAGAPAKLSKDVPQQANKNASSSSS